MKHLIAVAVAAVATVVTSGAAFAQPALTQPSVANAEAPVTITSKDWYGWQMVMADTAALGGAVATHNGELALAWFGTGAFVHAAHGNNGRATASVALRVGLPLVGFVVGASTAKGCHSDGFCGLDKAALGGLVGMGVAEISDLAMASEETTVVVPARTSRWTPVASVRQSSASVGFAARF